MAIRSRRCSMPDVRVARHRQYGLELVSCAASSICAPRLRRALAFGFVPSMGRQVLNTHNYLPQLHACPTMIAADASRPRHRPADRTRPARRLASTARSRRCSLNRPAKRNAINDTLIAQLHTCFINLPKSVRVVVLSGEGEHFCAGLDLSELAEHDVAGGIAHSRSWHAAFDAIQMGRVPVIAVLHGAVIGGGLELASAAPHPHRRGRRVLRPARRPARPLRRRRRVGAHPAAGRACR